MIVVFILGFLVAMATLVLINLTRGSKTRACQANLRTIDGAVRSYKDENNFDPDVLANLIPAFLKKMPTCPVDADHPYFVIPASEAAQAAVACGDNGGRDGLEDTNHLD